MHILISIVDDNKNDYEFLKERIESWSQQTCNTVDISYFPDGSSFIKSLRAHKVLCNVVFLDVLMPKKTGLQIADILNNEFVGIYKVLYSSAIEYTNKGYIVNAVRYLLKNSKDLNEDIAECMEYIKKRLNEDASFYYDASTARTKYKPIPCNQIVSVTVEGNYAVINTINGDHIRHRSTLKNVQDQLPDNFLICNRNTLVNARFIRQVREHRVRMDDGTEFSVSLSQSSGFTGKLSEIL